MLEELIEELREFGAGIRNLFAIASVLCLLYSVGTLCMHFALWVVDKNVNTSGSFDLAEGFIRLFNGEWAMITLVLSGCFFFIAYLLTKHVSD